MKVTRLVLYSHILSVIGAYFLFGLSLFHPRRTLSFQHLNAADLAVAFLAVIGFMLGMGAMAARSAKSESVLLAASTIAALALFLLVLR